MIGSEAEEATGSLGERRRWGWGWRRVPVERKAAGGTEQTEVTAFSDQQKDWLGLHILE